MSNGNGDCEINPVMNTSVTGNLSFDLVLSPARTASPRSSKILQSPVSGSPSVSLEEIEIKLRAAKENRERLIDEKLEKLKEHEKRINEVRKSREMQTSTLVEDSLRQMVIAEQLRQMHLEELVLKLKEHDNRIAAVRERLTTRQTDDDELERQLGDATARREAVLQAIQEKQEQEKRGGGQHKENITP